VENHFSTTPTSSGSASNSHLVMSVTSSGSSATTVISDCVCDNSSKVDHKATIIEPQLL
jgi:hypothetical protein